MLWAAEAFNLFVILGIPSIVVGGAVTAIILTVKKACGDVGDYDE